MGYGKCLTAVSKSLAVAIITMGLAAGSLCAGQEAVLHTFVNKADGNSPGGGLTFDTKGNLFGTTSVGGTGEFADGTAFELTPKASGGFTFHTIHQFSAATGDGASPGSAFILDANGNLYGVTPNGGNGCGIVYELSPPRVESGKRPSCTSSTAAGRMDAIPVAI
jgi:hypothetical protein